MTLIRQTYYMTVRHLRAFLRQPYWVAIALVQPVIWILLFGALFKRIVEIPGFGSDSYITFLTPGIVIMSAMFSGGWAGMGVIEDMDRGIMDRLLVTPAHRAPLLLGRLVQQAIAIVIQSVILIVLGFAIGARFPGGFLGIVVLILCGILLGAAFGSLSNGLGLLVRREETVIAAVQFILLPLSFLSATFLQIDLAPGWIQAAAKYNPVNWAVQAGRDAIGANTDWSNVLAHAGYLMAFSLVALWLSLAAFRAYRRSV